MGDKDSKGEANKCNLTSLEEIKGLNYNEINKASALKLVVFAVCVSFALLGVGLWVYCKSIPSEPSLKKQTESICNASKNVETNCCRVQKEEPSPSCVIEYRYDNTSRLLLYGSILVFISLSLWGTFTILLKVLKSEHEINSKILDVELKIYNEQQMWKITKQKNKTENNIPKENASSEKDEKEKAKKYDEILKKMDMLEESVDFIKSNISSDDKKILDSIKKYIGVIKTKK